LLSLFPQDGLHPQNVSNVFIDYVGTFLVEEPAARHAAGQVADASPVGEKGHQGLVPIGEGP